MNAWLATPGTETGDYRLLESLVVSGKEHVKRKRRIEVIAYRRRVVTFESQSPLPDPSQPCESLFDNERPNLKDEISLLTEHCRSSTSQNTSQNTVEQESETKEPEKGIH